MCELNAGIRSAEEEGWISEDELRTHFHNRKNEMTYLLRYTPEAMRDMDAKWVGFYL